MSASGRWRTLSTGTRATTRFKFGGDLLHNWDLINALSGSGTAGTSLTASGNGSYYYPYIGNLFADLNSKGSAGTCNSTGSADAVPRRTSAVGTYQCYTGYAQGFGNPTFGITTLDWGALCAGQLEVVAAADAGVRRPL